MFVSGDKVYSSNIKYVVVLISTRYCCSIRLKRSGMQTWKLTEVLALQHRKTKIAFPLRVISLHQVCHLYPFSPLCVTFGHFILFPCHGILFCIKNMVKVTTRVVQAHVPTLMHPREHTRHNPYKYSHLNAYTHTHTLWHVSPCPSSTACSPLCPHSFLK